MMAKCSPDESELKDEIVKIKSSDPQLGISKIHAFILQNNSTWTVSEKRVKKILQSEGLIIAPLGQVSMYPTSRLIPNLDLKQWTGSSDIPKFKIVYLDKKKGKGLIAVESIKEGQSIWKEDPWIIAPEWEFYDLIQQSAACSLCTTPFSDPTSPLIKPCPASTVSSHCPARFCNRLCFNRSQRTHPLVCPVQNPACIPLLRFAREAEWMALHALTQCTARCFMSTQLDSKALESDWQILRSFAEMGMEERYKNSYKLSGKPEPDRQSWKRAYELFVQAFRDPPSPVNKKKLAKILKKPVPPDIVAEVTDSYEGFLRGLGRMGLNLEAHGGIYILHSHLNHSCDPNVSVRHLDQRTALSRISIIAKRDIQPGEELVITYVNPEGSYRTRQSDLAEWGFGGCDCSRCVEEKKHQDKQSEGVTRDSQVEEDLAMELKAGLGVA